jgi:hypothetical protein
MVYIFLGYNIEINLRYIDCKDVIALKLLIFGDGVATFETSGKFLSAEYVTL